MLPLNDNKITGFDTDSLGKLNNNNLPNVIWQQKLNIEDIGGQDMCTEWNRRGFPRRAEDGILQAKGNREGQNDPEKNL